MVGTEREYLDIGEGSKVLLIFWIMLTCELPWVRKAMLTLADDRIMLVTTSFMGPEQCLALY